jgi:hypothetical protein
MMSFRPISHWLSVEKSKKKRFLDSLRSLEMTQIKFYEARFGRNNTITDCYNHSVTCMVYYTNKDYCQASQIILNGQKSHQGPTFGRNFCWLI